MIRQVFLAGILATTGILAPAGQNNAFACNKTDGCVMDVIREDNNMRRDGRSDKAIKAGQDNIEAFRLLQAKQKAYSAGR